MVRTTDAPEQLKRNSNRGEPGVTPGLALAHWPNHHIIGKAATPGGWMPMCPLQLALSTGVARSSKANAPGRARRASQHNELSAASWP